MSQIKNSATKKNSERRILEAARAICPLFPSGEIELSERPDLLIRTDTGSLGIEITELLRPKVGKSLRPVENEAFHRKVLRLAEKNYDSAPDAKPVWVGAAFLDEEQCSHENPEGWSRLNDQKTGNKAEKMSKALAEFVERRVLRGICPVTFSKREMPGESDDDVLPTGFEAIGISTFGLPLWTSCESASLCPLKPDQLDLAIQKKNKLLPQYRHSVPGTPIWLLISSRVARGVPIHPSVTEWKFAFDFEKVFLFSEMDNQIFEIGHL